MKLYQTPTGPIASEKDRAYALTDSWDQLVARDDLSQYLRSQMSKASASTIPSAPLAPIHSQEVWAAGVTYKRSREARMEESKSAGGGDFYDRVYAADRPELFFKSTGHRVVDPGGKVRIRRDSKWNV